MPTAPKDAARPRIVALMASYRPGHTVDRATREVLRAARIAGAEVEQIRLAEQDLRHCTNCRTCMLQPGPERGPCVIQDDVHHILERMEAADGLVLAAPVNFGDVNALTRTLLERMVGFAHWPDGAPAPKPRRRGPSRPAVLITASAAPALLTRTVMRPLRTLGQMGELLGARRVGSLVCGRAKRSGVLSERHRRRARALGDRLARRAATGARR